MQNQGLSWDGIKLQTSTNKLCIWMGQNYASFQRVFVGGLKMTSHRPVRAPIEALVLESYGFTDSGACDQASR